MKLFSWRMGIKRTKTAFQVDAMDDALRNRLWNILDIACWTRLKETTPAQFASDPYVQNSGVWTLCSGLWSLYFKEPLDEMPRPCATLYSEIRQRFFAFSWNEVYDFLEFVVENDDKLPQDAFIMGCNSVLEQELSAYRFVGKEIAPMTDEVEIAGIEEALDQTTLIVGANAHLSRGLELLSDREEPDYRNSIKESISAVEAVAQFISGDPNATLARALDRLSEDIELHSALKEGFKKIYGYTSNAEGIRHALSDAPNLTFDDAKFMLVSCSAFVNYLIAKSQEAGIDLAPDQ